MEFLKEKLAQHFDDEAVLYALEYFCTNSSQENSLDMGVLGTLCF